MSKHPILERPEGAAIVCEVMNGRGSSGELEELFPAKRRIGNRPGEGCLPGNNNPTAAIAMRIRPLIDAGILEREGKTNGAKVKISWEGWACRICETYLGITEELKLMNSRDVSYFERGVVGLSQLLEKYVNNLFKQATPLTIIGIEEGFIRYLDVASTNNPNLLIGAIEDSTAFLVLKCTIYVAENNPAITGPYGIKSQGFKMSLKEGKIILVPR